MGTLALRFCKLLFGLVLYALGIVLTIRANIGYGSWEVFHAGLSSSVGITIGTAGILVGIVIVAITLVMGEKIGLGTLLNMVLIGVFLDLILKSDVIPRIGNVYTGIAVLVAGLYVISLGSYFYIGSGFGAGPRDGLMVVLTRETKLPIGVVRSAIELSATLLGWMLGGMVGIGTIIAGFVIGLCVQSTFRLLGFDPTRIRHSTIAETCDELRSGLRRG